MNTRIWITRKSTLEINWTHKITNLSINLTKYETIISFNNQLFYNKVQILHDKTITIEQLIFLSIYHNGLYNAGC